MPKLHTILAVGQGRKSEVEKEMGTAYKLIQKPELFDGFSKTYQAATVDATGTPERLPAETKVMQHRLPDVVRDVNDKLVELFDVILTMDGGNQLAKADVVVDGQTLAKAVPVPTLLFMLKELENVRTFVEKLPTPDPAHVWLRDDNQGLLATQPTETARTKKIQRPIVKYDATKEHPAQTEMITEDVLAGYWTAITYTSRIPAVVKAKMLDRVTKLRDAVKVAKETANDIEVEKKAVGAAMLGYVFGDYLK